MSWHFGGFSALDRAVRTVLEPRRLRLRPGMVGRHLKRQIERDINSEVPGGGDKAIEVVERAQFRIDRRMAPRSDPMAQGLPGSPAAARARCFDPCGWWIRSGDGCEVEHVEAEVGDLPEPAFDVAQRAGRSRRSCERANSRAQAPPRPPGSTITLRGRSAVAAALLSGRDCMSRASSGSRAAATRTGCARSLAGPPHFHQPPGLLTRAPARLCPA